MNEDAELLRRYAEENSEEAFAELVRRHVNLVYFAALRQVGGDAHRAHDVAQSVFTDLARKARPLSRHAVLTGWLYTSTHFAAAKLVRTEQRRHVREQEAHLMQENASPSVPEADWNRLRPVLDDVMLELNDRDREAVLLRFFEGRPFADVGAKLRLTEDAARMRVERALDKLRAQLTKRGVSSTTAALGLALANQIGLAAPAGLAATVTGVALQGAASAGSWGLLGFLAMNKLPIGLTGALAVAGASGLLVQQQANAALRREIAVLQSENQQIVSLENENRRLVQTTSEVTALRQDDAELARLQQEISKVKTDLAAAEKARALATAEKRAREQLAAAPATEPAEQPKTLDQMPRPVYQAKPVYPTEMQNAGITGQVVLSFVVGSNGEVVSPSVASSTRPEFEASALEAIGKWKFEAGIKGGRKVNTRLQVPMVFRVAGSGLTTAGTPTTQSEKAAAESWF